MAFTSSIIFLSLTVLIMSTSSSGDAISNGNDKSFILESCSAHSGDSLGYVVLETKQPSTFEIDGFCQAIAEGPAYSGNYNLTLQLFNNLGFGSDIVNSGHLGAAFNVKDSMNYDFIFFRPHSKRPWFTYGYVQDATVHQSEVSAGPNAPPRGRVWFTVLLQVAHHSTRVFVDGVRVTTFFHHHVNVARGGAVVANGYRNRVYFRGYHSSPWGSPAIIAACSSHHAAPAYNTLDASTGPWGGAVACRVLIGQGVATSKYFLSVDLYNVQGWKGINSGHLGVMYNVQDMNNFDIVYFRPHSSSQCFQTGYVRNSHSKFDGGVSSICPDGPPAGRHWFNVDVHVDGASAAIYKDGVLVHTARPKFQPKGSGGVIVFNAYKNVIRYKKFRIVPE